MRLQDQVCTEIQSNRLMELGIAQVSLFRWHFGNAVHVYYGNERYLSAFTVAEFGVMLPSRISISKGTKEYTCRYWWGNFIDGILREGVKENSWHQTKAVNMAECMAEMILYLLENKLTTPEEVNQRLIQ